MKLKTDVELISFFQKIRQCKGEVEFHSMQGDILNLKSSLSQYLFASLMARPEFLLAGEIICKEESDRELLRIFAKKEGETFYE